MYSAEKLDASRIIVHVNKTDVEVLFIYYFATRKLLKELFVRTEPCTFLPIREIANSLGREKCLLLPFLNTFSGKDNTSFLYGIEKKAKEVITTGKFKSTKHLCREFGFTNSK